VDLIVFGLLASVAEKWVWRMNRRVKPLEILMKFIKKLYIFCKISYKEFISSEGLFRAAELAYTTLLSLVPLMIVSLGLFSAFPAFKKYAHIFNGFLFDHLVPSSAKTMQYYIESFALHSTGLSVAGTLLAFITSIMLIFSMESTFNSIFKVKKRRKNMTAFLVYWAILTAVPPLAACAFAASIFILSLPYLSSLVEILSNFRPILYVLPVIILFCIFSFLYKTLPNCEVKFRYAAIGAAVAAPLFEIVKLSFGTYISHFSSYTLIYGAAAIIPIFLIWLYVLWVIIIIGAVITYVSSVELEKRR